MDEKMSVTVLDGIICFAAGWGVTFALIGPLLDLNFVARIVFAFVLGLGITFFLDSMRKKKMKHDAERDDLR